MIDTCPRLKMLFARIKDTIRREISYLVSCMLRDTSPELFCFVTVNIKKSIRLLLLRNDKKDDQ